MTCFGHASVPLPLIILVIDLHVAAVIIGLRRYGRKPATPRRRTKP